MLAELAQGSSSTSSDLRECGPQLCSPHHCEKEFGAVTCDTSLSTALLLPLLQKQNLPADLTGRWSFSVRGLHFFHTKTVSIQSKIFQSLLTQPWHQNNYMKKQEWESSVRPKTSCMMPLGRLNGYYVTLHKCHHSITHNLS